LTALRIRPAIFAYLVGFAVLLVMSGAAGTASADTGGLGYGQADSSLLAPGQMLGQTVKFSGNIPSAKSGDTIEIQKLDAKLGWGIVTTTTASAGGNFTAQWIPTKAEKMQVRAVPTNASVRAASAIPTKTISVYKSFAATWFGPGFFGNRTGCGKKMTRKLIGVAHKTLKCGTKVEIYYKGRTIVAPVVDRGPFRKGTAYDLTYAAAKKLKFNQSDSVGALTVPKGS
jgi:rare lipoprotein A (peptidoglycan hydrolase)